MKGFKLVTVIRFRVILLDFINKNQIMAYYGKDDTGIFEVRFSVKEE